VWGQLKKSGGERVFFEKSEVNYSRPGGFDDWKRGNPVGIPKRRKKQGRGERMGGRTGTKADSRKATSKL